MTALDYRLALGIELPFITPNAENFHPATWPPLPDFPVIIDQSGIVISRYGDAVWNLSVWAGRPLQLDFQDSGEGPGGLSKESAAMARLISAWWLWGPRPVNNAGTLKSRFTHLFPIFKLCTTENVNCSNLYKSAHVVDKIPEVLSSSLAEPALILLHTLYEQRFEFGSIILDRESLRRLSGAVSKHEGSQTAYIPPRIWTYQVNRLREFLEDYSACSKQIADCYNECIDLYKTLYGSMDNIFDPKAPRREKHFGQGPFGSFSAIARKHGLLDVLKKWIKGPNTADSKCTILTFGSYMSLATKVGNAYILNFSLMRIEEAWKLRYECLQIEKDPQFGLIYTLGGITTKTLEDEDARWVTSPSVELAVNVLRHVIELRIKTASERLGSAIPQDQVTNPTFNIRQYEPWARGNGCDKPFTVRPGYSSYLSTIESYPLLFDKTQILIQETDLEYARLITPSLNGDEFSVGKPWPFAWHQLRRTGAVNMQASSLVSDPSIQYQLKHATRAMTLYYGRGYSKVRLDPVAHATYLKAMYEVLGQEITRLLTPRFVSPFGDAHKTQILKIVSLSDAKTLAKSAKKGLVSWRETLIGGCTKRGNCTHGGVDNIIRCGGGDGKPPCADGLYDRERKSEITQLRDEIQNLLTLAPPGSPYYDSLISQDKAVVNVLNTLNMDII
jgi:hypothetical protein